MRILHSFLLDNTGVIIAEYGLIATLFAAGIIAGMGIVQEELATVFQNIRKIVRY